MTHSYIDNGLYDVKVVVTEKDASVEAIVRSILERSERIRSHTTEGAKRPKLCYHPIFCAPFFCARNFGRSCGHAHSLASLENGGKVHY